MFDDVTSQTLQVALSGLALRQRVTANNIANLSTPNFHAGKVEFENSLQAALSDGGSPTGVAPTVGQSLEPTQLNGNNVNLDEETLSSVDTGLRYQLALRAMDGKFSLISDVVKGN
ncbi:MAG: flagellar biosynthesis protein FlgB [Actinobacteria bacterium 13_1_20CM_3_71_11]|nr:MAG: flagellar biosynthesis protein FlgB [Actinobacteria bacterium 13_1_20CM_3_71_11]